MRPVSYPIELGGMHSDVGRVGAWVWPDSGGGREVNPVIGVK